MSPLLLLLASGAAHAGAWRVVGAYDFATLSVLADPTPQEVWRPSEGMNRSCGAVKGAEGLGEPDYALLANGQMPALALVLQGPGELGPASVRVSIGEDGPDNLLQPAVLPRRLRVHVHGDADPRYLQLVESQLQIELCLEHRLGRGWTGGRTTDLREAFLLDPPGSGRAEHQRYFVGQGFPIPALVGPPDACLVAGGTDEASAEGDGSMSLAPSDVWGSHLRTCGDADRGGGIDAWARHLVRTAARAEPWLPSPASDPVPAAFAGSPAWTDVDIELRAGTPPLVTMTVGGERILDAEPLFPGTDDSGELIDLVARIPQRYPSLPAGEDGQALVLLLVPGWQVEWALDRLAPGDGPTAAVASILAHPEHLFVQVAPEEASSEWPDLAGALRGGRFRQHWGYAAGFEVGRSPTVVNTDAEVDAEVALLASRARYQAAFLVGVLITGLAAVAGLRRLRELWAPIPEERIDYWPGAPVQTEGPEGGAPEVDVVGGDE